MKAAALKETVGEVAICSLQGRRKVQEDRVAHWVGKDGSHFVVLCDGAGGHGGGAGASAAAVEAAQDLWSRSGEVISDAPDFLSRWMVEAHEAVNAEGERTGMRGRAVVVAAVIKGNRADWVHAGDCRVYHLRGKEILKRTRDDSVVQVLFERGDITEEEMGTHPDQNRLLQSLGGKESPRPQHDAGELQPGDRVLLCSDGLWEFLDKDEIGLIGYPSQVSPQEQLEHAVSESISRAGEKADNTSAAVLCLEGNHGDQGPELGAAPVGSRSLIFLGAVVLLLLALVAILVIDDQQQESLPEKDPREEKVRAEQEEEETELKEEGKAMERERAVDENVTREKAEANRAEKQRKEEELKSREAALVITKALELFGEGKLGSEFFGQVDRESLSSAAEGGDLRAQYVWGKLHDSAGGLLNDDKKALEWYRKAAAQGYAAAQFEIGRMYTEGRGVARDDEEAVKWYRKAAEQDDPEAQYSLGLMYLWGEGVEKNPGEAVKWFRKAAEQGYAAAQFEIGRMYTDGRGVVKDDEEAVKWYRKAAEQGNRQAKEKLRELSPDE